jgi:hypothetical protein
VDLGESTLFEKDLSPKQPDHSKRADKFLVASRFLEVRAGTASPSGGERFSIEPSDSHYVVRDDFFFGDVEAVFCQR